MGTKTSLHSPSNLPKHPLIERFHHSRSDTNLAVLEGFHALKHALRFGAEIIIVVTTDTNKLERFASLLAPDLQGHLTKLSTVVPPEIFEQLAPYPPRTGVVALAKRPKIKAQEILADRRLAPIVLLENPRNLMNMGACVRVAAAVNTAGVLTTGTNDPWHPDALRGAAGLHFAVPVSRIDNLLPSNRPLIAIDPGGEPIDFHRIPPRALLVFGSERYGISQSLLKKADGVFSIPMRAGVSSLNLATSVAAVLFGWQFCK